MDNETLVALKESIKIWKHRARDKGYWEKCPLCIFGRKRSAFKCDDCIIKERTGQRECYGTPFWSGDLSPLYEKNMVNYLESFLPIESFLPKEKDKDIKQNDIVAIFDGSYSIELKDKLLDPKRNICTGLTYIVLATDLKLPTRRGDGSVNDTIVQEITNRDYIFTQKGFLRLKHRCDYCPKCGESIKDWERRARDKGLGPERD